MEAQRLKLASEMGRGQADTVFVFDEPTIGLHPRDVEATPGRVQRLVDQGLPSWSWSTTWTSPTNADWVIDMGPGGGEAGGRVVACGTPRAGCRLPQSVRALPGVARVPVARQRRRRARRPCVWMRRLSGGASVTYVSAGDHVA